MHAHASLNRIYRLVWSSVHQAWVATSEISRGRGKAVSSGLVAAALSIGSGAMLFLQPSLAHAAPAGGQVVSGSASIAQSGSAAQSTTTITQSSNKLSLSWQSFNVGASETVNFVQPSATALAVNRIYDTQGSQILGRINANGQVWLINPNGVVFGQGAQINVGALVASTLDTGDATLGKNSQSFSGNSTASVTNLGQINAAQGGYVALLGHSVSNQGQISAPAGTAALGAGNAVSLNFAGSKLLGLQVEQSQLNALAANGGLIRADGGQVLLSAGARDSLLASAVNNTGIIQARTVQSQGGKIILLGGMAAGTTSVGGTLDASAPDGGKGGFVETSAHTVNVADGARITTASVLGKAGTWLIDPADFTVASTGGNLTGMQLSAALGENSVEIQSSSGTEKSTSQGNVNIYEAVTWTSGATLTITASKDVNITRAVTGSGAGAALVINSNTANGEGNVASGNGRLNASGVLGGTMSVTLNGSGTGSSYLSAANTYTGDTTITGGTLYVGNGSTGSIASSNISNAGSLRFYRNSDLAYAGNISGAGSVTQYGSGTLTLSGSNTYTGTTWVRAGTLALRGGSAIGDNSAVGISAGASLNVLDSETIGSLSGSAATGSTGASAVAIGSGATLSTGGTNISSNFAGVISGQGNLTKTGTASLTLTGDNTYTGETAITGGTLYVGNGNSGSIASGTIVNAGSLRFYRNSDLAYAGNISGAGSVTQYGSGTLTLSGSNTYTGTTWVRAGTLALRGGSAIGDNSAVGISAGATLNVLDSETIGSLNGSGATASTGASMGASAVVLSSGATLTTGGTNISSNFAGVISGEGGLLKTGTASLTLAGDNTYTGETAITGGTLYVGNGSTGSIASGTIVNAGSLRFYRNSDLAYAGNISGTGSVTQYGSGTLTLSGSNTYTGTTWVRAGTLALRGGSAIGDNSAVGISAGATLNVLDSETIGSLSGSAATGGTSASAVAIGSGATLSTGGTNISSNFAGVISGQGNLTKTGTASLTLTGDNTYTGETAITGGTLIVQSDAPKSFSSLYHGSGTLAIRSASASFGSSLDTSGWAIGSQSRKLGNLYLGKSGNAADINIGQNHYLSGILALDTTGKVTQSAAISAGALVVRNASAAALDNTENKVGILAASGVGDLTYVNAGNLAVGTVGGTVGISANGLVDITTQTGDLAINANISASAGALSLASDGAISASGAIDVGTFTLNSGNWRQVSNLLPNFKATDFRLNGGTFVRALSGNGSESSKYQLTDVYGLQGVGTLPDQSYALANDIDASGTSAWNGGSGFSPIGSWSAEFSGTFDGVNHTITHLTINRPDAYFVGLFGYTETDAVIRNVVLQDSRITGGGAVGGLVGLNAGSISDSYANGSINGVDGVGGLVGANEGDISNSHASGTVSGELRVGGLAGLNLGTIINSQANASVNGQYDVGGLVGDNAGTLAGNLSYSGNVTASGDNIGGLIGRNRGNLDASNGSVVVVGDVIGGSNVGGLVGYNEGAQWEWDADGWRLVQIEGTLAGNLSYSGNVTGSGDNIGGLIGYNAGNLDGSNGSVVVVGNVIGGSNVGGLVGYNEGHLKGSLYMGIDSWVGANLSSSGTVTGSGDNIGGLVGRNVGTVVASLSYHGTVKGSGENIGGSIGYNSGDLWVINNHDVDGGYGLMVGNVTGGSNVGGLVGRNDGDVFGTLSSSGTVTGSGDNIGGLVGSNNGTLIGHLSYSGTVTGSGANIGGLIGYNTANLDGSNGAIVVVGNVIGDTNVGGLVGWHNGGTISGISVSNSVQGVNSVGGLVGLNHGAIVSSSSTGTVNGGFAVGGFVGDNSGDIHNSYATGKVNGLEFVGGLVGLNIGSIGNSYATGTVRGIADVDINSSGNNVGGLVGANDDQAFISNSYATGDVSGALGVAGLAGVNYGAISRSWASGNVSGVFNVGGLVGDNFNSISDTYATGDVHQIYTGEEAFRIGNIGGLVGTNDVTGSISSSYSTGYVDPSRAAGGLVGVSTGTITHSYFNQTNNPLALGVGVGNAVSESGVTPLYSVHFKDPARFKGFDFETTWVMDQGSGYPKLRSSEPLPPAHGVYSPTTGPVDLSIYVSK